VLADISAQAQVPLTATPALSARKISCRLAHRATVKFMWYLTRVIDVSWRRSAAGYQLYQTDAQIAKERPLKRVSEAREAAFVNLQRETLRKEIGSAMLAPERSRNPMATFLSGCDSGAIEFGPSSAIEDEPLISATDQSHFLTHFADVKPYSSLSQPQQQAVSQIARSTGYTELSPSSMVGMIAAAGGFRLGIASSSGGADLWVAPAFQLGHAAVLSDNVRENDFDPSVVSLIATERATELSALPSATRRLAVPIDRLTNRNYLSQLLMSVCLAGGFDFLSDSYLNSGYSAYVQLSFPPDQQYTVERAIRAIGRGFAHRMAFRDGVLLASTLTPGLDLRLERSAAVMNSLDAQAKTGSFPNRADLLVLAECTKTQLGLLHMRHPVRHKTYTGHILQAYRSYSFLRFYESLSPAQKARSASSAGLSASSMDSAQRSAYLNLVNAGARRMTPANLKLEKGHFYVLRSSVPIPVHPRREAVDFAVTDPNDPTHCRMAPL